MPGAGSKNRGDRGKDQVADPLAEREQVKGRHPSQEHRNLHSEDIVLRSHGYKIHSRPKAGPAIWCKQGKLYTHQDAISRIEATEEIRRLEGGETISKDKEISFHLD